MNPDPDRAARMQREASGQPSPKSSHSRSASVREAHLREIPSVDELLSRPRVRSLCETAGRGLVTDAIRAVLADIRSHLLRETPAVASQALQSAAPARTGPPPDLTAEALESRIGEAVRNWLAPSLRRAINATGVILHTNLGRAPISAAAIAAFEETATRYSNLEYDIDTGQRGKRDVHTSKLLESITGAEAAIVVNNNAAAVLLVLNTLAKGTEVVVSRGELIEIGDGFRIPDIMAESGAILREVGTTNRTRIRDYERAINERTHLLLRVHSSNFRITGFTERPSLEDLILLGERSQIPVYEDLGSGCLADLSAAGISEPVVKASSEAGVSVVSFSGDKLLGGPQAGIIAGKMEIVERIRRNPLFRALRVDKLTIAALEATLKAYHRGALDEIPALRMIRASREEIGRRVSQFADRLRTALPAHVSIEMVDGFSVIGGGSTPEQQLANAVLALRSDRHSPSALDELLRKPAHGIPVVARVMDDRLIVDLRTVFPDEEGALAATLASAVV
ncbi:MAG TPA: L-seryl-tRNA(Sec) selenium transferase [Candidatus Acidoferrum sp.]|nr:L-seryl-tRNA(Sec) selenium transferase [Candidatus Acidoferrum sp.]